MSFGFGVGDFIAVGTLLSQVRKQFLDAPEQFKAISEEVKSLSNVLRDSEDIVPEKELTPKQKTDLKDILNGCTALLDNLNSALEHYQDLDSKSSKTPGARARRIWKRLKWEPKDITELRDKISSNIGLLNAFNGRLTSHMVSATKDGVGLLTAHRDDKDRQNILDWLSPVSFASLQSDFIERRQEGTGQWLLDSHKFKDWIDNSGKTVYCTGMPGAGKTIITSIVINDLFDKFRKDDTVGIAFMYCNFRRKQEQTVHSLISGLLKQLVQRLPTIPAGVKNSYQQNKSSQGRLSLSEIMKLFSQAAEQLSRTFIMIDALDECEGSDKTRDNLLSSLSELQAKHSINIFATSRFKPEIAQHFRDATSLEIRASDADVRKYVEGQIPRLRPFVRKSPKLQAEIISTISESVDGMFLLAQLHVDSLRGKPAATPLRRALESFKKSANTPESDDKVYSRYNKAYDEAMDRINSQDEDLSDLARRVLMWISCAKRPLSSRELQEALAVEEGVYELDEGMIIEIEEILSVCEGLVTFDEESDTVRLVHFTTQEYFIRKNMAWFPQAHNEITVACLTYLSFDTFNKTFKRRAFIYLSQPDGYDFYDYAAKNWMDHARIAGEAVTQPFLHLCELEAGIANAWYYIKPGLFSRPFAGASGMHLAAHFGLNELILALLQRGYDVKGWPRRGDLPIWWAARRGHAETVKLLIENGSPFQGGESTWKGTPLLIAAERGHNAVVKIFLEKGASQQISGKKRRTPLHEASANGHLETVNILIKGGATVDAVDGNNDTPLQLACSSQNYAVVRLLLASGADVNAKPKYGGTSPLHEASKSGHLETANVLIKGGATVDAVTGYGATPLHLACSRQNIALVNFLLAAGADVNTKDKGGNTSLQRAIENGGIELPLLLMQSGAIWRPVNATEWPTLWQAIKWGNGEMAALLLDKEPGFDIRCLKNRYRGVKPALAFAVWRRYENVVDILLKHGANPTEKFSMKENGPLEKTTLSLAEDICKGIFDEDESEADEFEEYGSREDYFELSRDRATRILKLLQSSIPTDSLVGLQVSGIPLGKESK